MAHSKVERAHLTRSHIPPHDTTTTLMRRWKSFWIHNNNQYRGGEVKLDLIYWWILNDRKAACVNFERCINSGWKKVLIERENGEAKNV